MVQESVPPATTEGYAILAAPLALHSYSARSQDIHSHLYILADLAGQGPAPLPLVCLLSAGPLHAGVRCNRKCTPAADGHLFEQRQCASGCQKEVAGKRS